MQWIPFLPKEGGLIQVDISGHPPFPSISKQISDNFGNLLFLAVFWVLNFQSHFEALNDVFLGIFSQNISSLKFWATFVSPRIDISNGLSYA
jgi:hypothetical protein